eukprot:gene292-6706_t
MQTWLWRLLATVVFIIGYTIRSDLKEYHSIIPRITEQQKESLYNFSDAPTELFTNKQPNIGVFSAPIPKLNHEKTTYLPLNYRLKKWEYHSITNPNWILSLFVVDLGYISQATIYFYNKRNKYEYSEESLFGLNLKKFDCLENGDRNIHWKSSENEIKMYFDFKKRKYEIEFNAQLTNENQIQGKIVLEKYHKKSDELSIVFPLSNENTAYTHKSSPLKITSGDIKFNNESLMTSTGSLNDSIATLDYTHSLELRQTIWKWISFAGKSKNNDTILINLTSKERFLDRENVVWINDKIYFLGDVSINYSTNSDVNIKVKNSKINFKKETEKTINIYALLVHTKFTQNVGTYSGEIKVDGKIFEFENIIGVAEDHYAKWFIPEESPSKKRKLEEDYEEDSYEEETEPEREEEEEKIPIEKKEFDIKKDNVWIMSNSRISIEKSCLNDKLIKTLKKDFHFSELFPVQRAVIPIILALHNSETNGDILVGSPTGSGKTLSYVLPILNILLKSRFCRLSAIILVPTINLAKQIHSIIKKFEKTTNKKSYCLLDNVTNELKVDILISTPKRFYDYKKTFQLNLKDVQFLVLDEVDKMMSDQNDSKIIEEIFPKNDEKNIKNEMFPIPKPYTSIRKMLFSATLTSNPNILSQLSRPQYFSLSQPYSKIKYVLPENLNIFLVLFDPTYKPLYIMELLKLHKKIVIFTSQNETAFRLYSFLSLMNLNESLFQIHGKLEKKEIEKSLNEFRKESNSILIASDSMSRGIDIDDIDCVINYDKPEKMKNFIHRSGRCARGNNKGTSYLLIENEQVQNWRQKFLKVKSNPIEEYFIDVEDLVTNYKNFYQILENLKENIKK